MKLIWHCLLINRNDTLLYRTKNKEICQRIRIFSFARNLSNKYGKQLSDTSIKTGLDAAKTASKKLVHKIAEVTGEIIGNKIAEKIVKLM